MGVPKKKQLFYSYAIGQSFIRQNGDDKKIECKKKGDRNNIIAVSSMSKPPEIIMKKLNEYKVSSITKVASSYKFCLIADGTFDYDVFIILGGEIVDADVEAVRNNYNSKIVYYNCSAKYQTHIIDIIFERFIEKFLVNF